MDQHFHLLWDNLAKVYRIQNKLEKSKKAFKNLIKLDPYNLEALVALGTIYVKLADYDEGIKTYQKVLSLKNNNPRVYLSMGHALKTVGIKVTQFSILGILASIDEATVNKLSLLLGMDSSTVTRTVDRLIKEKLVISRNGLDARKRLVRLTERGFSLLDSAIPHWEKAQRIIEDGFDDKFSDFLKSLKTSNKLVISNLNS